MGSSPEREEMAREKSRVWAVATGCGGRKGSHEAAWREGSDLLFSSCYCCAAALCELCGGRKEKRRERKEKEERKGKMKMRKIKDDLRSWSKNYFVKERNMSNYK
jgi:hypothetical protein